tara:strand:+ start:9602 stop:10075 length:474 start_codon:yes stop_codon:yes gene_type:complete
MFYRLNLVLHNPEIPSNAGNIIRLCHNTGASLHLIKPLGFNFQDKNLRRAQLDYINEVKIKIHNSFDHFIDSENPKSIIVVDTIGEKNHTEVNYLEKEYFIFGSEADGLPHSIIKNKFIRESVRIPMNKASRSINLSNSVSIIAYEYLRQKKFNNLI